MKVADLDPRPTERVSFDGWAQRVDAPLAVGCYVLAAFNGDILYIGQSLWVRSRMRAHLDNPRKRVRTASGVPHWLYYHLCEESELRALESGWIRQYESRNGGRMPPFNKAPPPAP